MDGSIPRLYWDTSVFICFLSEEEEDRRENCDELQRWDRDFNKVASLINVTSPTYVSQMPLLQVSSPIGPAPGDFTEPTPSSGPQPPSGHSQSDEKD